MIALTPFLATLSLSVASHAPTASVPTGHYVEARTASVFAGACHYNGELTTRGREALLAWSFEGGVHAGTPLAGAQAVAIVTGKRNLIEDGVAHTTVIHVDRSLSQERRAAVVELLKAKYAEVFGQVKAVVVSPLRVTFDADRYDVDIPKIARLAGRAMADRACCTMPTHVWYSPFVELEKPLVGCSELFSYSGTGLEAKWSCRADNDAFLGKFRIE